MLGLHIRVEVSWVAQLQSRITQGLMKHGGLRLMQRIAPVVRLGPYHFVTRHADIVAALHRHDVFGCLVQRLPEVLRNIVLISRHTLWRAFYAFYGENIHSVCLITAW